MIEEGTSHLRFCMKLYKMQTENGLYFVHEHPHGAKSWGDPVVKKLVKDWRVWKVTGDMCQYAMQQEDENGVGSVRKRTVFITNAKKIAERLDRKCDSKHRHIHLLNGKAKIAIC